VIRINKIIEDMKEQERDDLERDSRQSERTPYKFENYLIKDEKDLEEEEENDIIRIIMSKFNSKAKSKAGGSFFHTTNSGTAT
jgi:hypothetical protein